MNLNKYKTLIFDCDGVLLDSNSVKTEAFYQVALPYGKEYADRLVSYHKKKGGISRFKKFHYFFEHILEEKGFQKEMEEAIKRYGFLVRKYLLDCSVTEGLSELLDKISSEKRKIVVSGGMQKELREIFYQRNLARYFDEIYGSPDTKLRILQREIDLGLLQFPAVFVGDTEHDYECAEKFNIDFIFMSQYSEFSRWKDYFKNKEVNIIFNLTALEHGIKMRDVPIEGVKSE